MVCFQEPFKAANTHFVVDLSFKRRRTIDFNHLLEFCACNDKIITPNV